MNNKIQINRFWSLGEVAESLGVHQNTVRRWTATGLLQAAKFGGVIRIAEADVQAFVQRARIQPAETVLVGAR